jgi:hypothetical protein
MADPNVFLYRMPVGYPGQINRVEQAKIEAQVIMPATGTNVPAALGIGLVVDATTGFMRTPIAGDAITSLYGLIVREYPTQGGQADALGSYTLPIQGAVSIMKSGYMMVLVGGAAAPSKGSPVYWRINGAVTGKQIGGFEAALDATPANTLLVPNAYWTGAADATGICEIAYDI